MLINIYQYGSDRPFAAGKLEDGYFKEYELWFNLNEKVDQVVYTNTRYIDQAVVKQLKNLGATKIKSFKVIDVRNEELEIFDFQSNYNNLILRADFDINFLDHEQTTWNFIIERNEPWCLQKILDILCKPECASEIRFCVWDLGFTLTLLRSPIVKFIRTNHAVYVRCGKGTVAMANISFYTNSVHDNEVLREWTNRVEFNNIRQRDIPGFERILIENGMEHLI